MVKNSDIIAIFNLHGQQAQSYMQYIKQSSDRYKVIDTTGGEEVYSCILTKDTIYLSTISSLTLKKRMEEPFSIAVYKNF